MGEEREDKEINSQSSDQSSVIHSHNTQSMMSLQDIQQVVKELSVTFPPISGF